MTRCDCLNDCGDDPWLKDGRSTPCERRQKLLAGAEFVSAECSVRHPTEVVIKLSKAPSEQDLQELSRRLCNLRGV